VTRLTPKRFAFVAGALLAAAWLSPICWRAYLFDGLWSPVCPSGRPIPRLELHAYDVRRGATGEVGLRASARVATDADDAVGLDVPLVRFTPRVELVAPDGHVHALSLAPRKSWRDGAATLSIPTGPDGDYVLRAHADTPLGPLVAEAELALYAPAQLVLVVDRPLVRPGETVRARVVGLRAADLAPLAGRAGRFELVDPSGEAVLELPAALSPNGVASARLPLTRDAALGAWAVRYRSGAAVATTTLEVARFELPRAKLELATHPSVLGVGARPRVELVARYASGAPVADAEVELALAVRGAWPPPPAWLQPARPRPWRTDRDGRFVAELGPVPDDLVGEAKLVVAATVVEPGGERTTAAGAWPMAVEPFHVDVVTELGEGLVEGVPNRVFMRLSRPDGEVLSETPIQVSAAHGGRARPVEAETDADGVAELVIDPGRPTNVLVPAVPVRPPPAPPPISLSDALSLLHGGPVDATRAVELEAWAARARSCAVYALAGIHTVDVVLRVGADGRWRVWGDEATPARACLAEATRGFAGRRGADDLIRVSLALAAPPTPHAEVTLSPVDTDAPLDVEATSAALTAALLARTRCLPADLVDDAELPLVAAVEIERAPPRLTVRELIPTPAPTDDEAGDEADEGDDGEALDAAPSLAERRGPRGAPSAARGASDHAARLAWARCLLERLPPVRLEAAEGGLQTSTTRALAKLRVHAPQVERAARRARATTMLGYALEVSIPRGGAIAERATVRLAPGQVPPLRIRALPALAAPGQSVEVELVRGPGYAGRLPERLTLVGRGHALEARVDEARRARFTLPADATGFFEVAVDGARALVFVPQDRGLEVELSSDRPRYAPGETARLRVVTRHGGRGRAATVGLVGVDASLGQLVTLPTPAVFDALTPPVETIGGAIGGVLDAHALVTGRVRGQSAARALVLRVGARPDLPGLDTPGAGHGATTIDPHAVLVDNFFGVATIAFERLDAWTRTAPAADKLVPRTMARLWREALEEAARRGSPNADAFGRPIRLATLPPELLALLAPNAVGVAPERLPEDIEDWATFVARERP
jgi:hypothetical protein